MKNTLILACLSLLAMVGSASAQLIGVDFNNDASAPNHDSNDPGEGISPTFSDKGVLGESFIGINAAGKGIALSDGVTMDLTSTGVDPAFRDQWADGTSDLFRDFVQSDPNQTLTVTLHGLKPKTAYKLAGYGASTRSGKDPTTFTGALTGTTIGSVNGTPVSRSLFVLNQNYIMSTAMSDDSGSLTFTINGTGGGWGILNGFGLVLASQAPPDPAPTPAPAPGASTNAPSTNAPSATGK